MNSDTRQIAAFMIFAVVFALVGETTKAKTGVGTKAGTDVKIILGGTLATALLALLAEAGSDAAMFAKGLAAVTLLSSVLLNGTVVFGAIDKLTGTKTTTTTTKAAS